MKSGFIALGVIANHGGRIRELCQKAELGFAERFLEQPVEPLHKFFSSPHQLDEAGHVVLDVKRIDPTVALREVIPAPLAAA